MVSIIGPGWPWSLDHADLDAINRAAWERDIALARSRLDEKRWNDTWDRGQGLSLGEAVAKALS